MKLEGINKIYHNYHEDVQALTDIDLCIEDNGMIFIVGASGCGKTTLLHIISKQDNDFTGDIQINGNVEVIEQDIYLFESMKVIDNLLMVSNNCVLIDEWLEKFEMKDFMNYKISHLSIGQKKRIQVIRSLLVESDYLICDEPTASLDYENAEVIMKTLQSVSNNKCVLIVTHELALVDSYADRIITMDNGKIVDDKSIHQQNCLKLKNTLDLSKTLQRRVIFLLKGIRTHPIEYILKLCLISLIFIMTFVCTSLFLSAKEAVIEKNKWRNSENIIITQPLEDNNKYHGHDDRVEEDGSYFYYDIYDKETIQLVRDNVKDVIGYRYGWAPQNYSLTNGSLTPEMTIYDIKEAIKEGDRVYKETGKIPFVQYEDFKRILYQVDQSHPNGDFDETIVLTVDFRNYEGFKDNSISYAPDSDIFKIGGKNNIRVVPYQLYNGYEMSVKYGKELSYDNEIIISTEVANALYKEYQFDSEEDLLEQEVSLSYFGGEETRVKICGISYTENINENQIYFKEGALDTWIEKAYDMNPDKLKYLYVYFLINPKADANKVSQDINHILNGKESSFVPYNDSFLTESQSYQNPIYFYIFSAFTCVGLLIIEIGIVLMNNKRYSKEERLMRDYGYSPLFHVLGGLILLCILAIGSQLLVLPSLCSMLNHFVNTLGFASFIEYDIIKYLISIGLLVLVLIMIEGGLYAFRTQKHL